MVLMKALSQIASPCRRAAPCRYASTKAEQRGITHAAAIKMVFKIGEFISGVLNGLQWSTAKNGELVTVRLQLKWW